MGFKALRITETSPGKFDRAIVQMQLDDLPPGELLIKVSHSSLNYKDALSATGNKGITKKFPHTPGIDAVGTVELSRSESFAADDNVVVTGNDLGMDHDGGFAEYIRIPALWAIKKPDEFTDFEAMAIGTAGLTAAQALYKMELVGQKPSDGPIVVTGATGGVGSMSVAILSKAGYEVIAVTGKKDAKNYLEHLGALRIESREFVNDKSGKFLLKTQWAGAIDTVGGNTLHTLLKACKPEGNVVTTGLVDSPRLDASVYPFILNGVSLLGIGSAATPYATKLLLWNKLVAEWNIKDKIPVIAKEASLEELSNNHIDNILQGKIMGRIVVKI